MLPSENIYATAEQIKTLDRLAETEYALSSYQLMKNAGEGIAHAIVNDLKSKEARFVIFCGKGNNGGDGIVVAKTLKAKGFAVHVVLLVSKSEDLSETSQKHLSEANFLASELTYVDSEQTLTNIFRQLTADDLLIDALLGISLKGELRGLYKQCVQQMNQSKQQVMAIDLPTGVDADRGIVSQDCIQASKTYCLAAKKHAMQNRDVIEVCGAIEVIDIDLPSDLLGHVFK